MKITLSTILLFVFTTSFAQLATPEICLVTVDPTYTFNQVVWQKDSLSVNIDYYKIYMDDGS